MIRGLVCLLPEQAELLRARAFGSKGTVAEGGHLAEASARYDEAKVLSQTTVGKRNRAFEAPEVIRTFAALERQHASPSGDTRTAPPTRRVPRRN